MGANSVGRGATRIGLTDWFSAMRVPLTDMPQALARRHVAAAGNVFWSAARQLDREPLLRTRWKRVLDATERAGPRIVQRWSIKFSADYYETKDREGGRNGPRLG
jgi:hypothetical protein